MTDADVNTYTINDREFRMIQDMTLDVFSRLSEIMTDLVDEKGEITMTKLMSFTRNSQRLRDLVTLILEPVKLESLSWLNPKRYLGRNHDLWHDLKHITIPDLLQVISDFFALGGPLQNAFPSFSAPRTQDSKQTPSIQSEA